MTVPQLKFVKNALFLGFVLWGTGGMVADGPKPARASGPTEWQSALVDQPASSGKRPGLFGTFLAFPSEKSRPVVSEPAHYQTAWDRSGGEGFVISDAPGQEPEAIVDPIEIPSEYEIVSEAEIASPQPPFEFPVPSFPTYHPPHTSAFRDWLRCRLEGCWSSRFDGLLLWRSAPQSRPLYTTRDPVLGDLGPTILDGDQFESDPFAGGRVSLIHCRPNGYAFETTYLYAGMSYAERSLPYLEDSYALAEPGIYSNPWGNEPGAPAISAVQAKLIGQLQSLEFNYREPIWHGLAKFIIGLRWVQWQESLAMTDQFIDAIDRTITGRDFYNTRCVNDLYGGQLGIDAMLYTRGSLRVEGLVKAGAYWNNAMQQSHFDYVTTQPFEFMRDIRVGTPRTASFVGEVNLTAVLPLRSNLDFRVGYVGLWLQGLAQPINQLSGQNLSQQGPLIPPTGSLTTNGQVLVQGMSLGLEGRW